MAIDLHIHSKASDGKFTVQEIFKEAKNRKINFISITDHDSISCQEEAKKEAKKTGIKYITGVELNVTFSNPNVQNGKNISLDFLGYQFEPNNSALLNQLEIMAKHREERASKILDNLNKEFKKEQIPALTNEDLEQIEDSVDGVLGRPHIAEYLIKKAIVKNRQEAFDKYLVKCDSPKFPLSLEDASKLICNAGGKLVLAHPNDPNGTSLILATNSLLEQSQIIAENMLQYINGIECWHSRSTLETTTHYVAFAKQHELVMTGGSDCHQKPTLMGTVDIPKWVEKQFT